MQKYICHVFLKGRLNGSLREGFLGKMAAGEISAPLNFKSLTEIKSLHAGGFAVLVRPPRERCDRSWVTDVKRDAHKRGGGDPGGEGAQGSTTESTQYV